MNGSMSEFARELTELVRGLAKDLDNPADGSVTALWPRVQELGLVGIGIDEAAGGSGGELSDLIVVIGELARAGIATPIVEASTAAHALGVDGADAFDTVVTNHVAHLGTPTLTADLGIVPFAQEARRVLIVGDADVAAIALADTRVEPLIDIAGLPAGRVRAVNGVCVHPDIDPGMIIERLTLARSASLIGNCRGAYELTKRYVLERQQFGAPLIEIPAVSTSLAQMAVRIRAAESALHRAVAVSSSPDSKELERFGAVAGVRIASAQAATVVARTAHQLHGAVGITREYGLHRYTRSLWAQRDADHSERDWSTLLGATALAVDEDKLWDRLTA